MAAELLTNDVRASSIAILYEQNKVLACMSTCGLVAMTSASHAEGRQFDPGQVYSRDRCAKELHTLLNKCYLCVVLERGTAKSGTRHLRSGTMAPLAQWLERWSYEP